MLSPRGAVTWMHRGERVTPEMLTSALDTHLQSGPRPIPIDFDPGLEIGAQVSTAALHPEWLDARDDRCPPLPLGRLGKEGSVISFVQKDGPASRLALRTLFDRFGQREPTGPSVVVVVDGATAGDTEVLKNELGVDFMTVPDPSGSITDRFRVTVWPTTITLDRRGVVTHIRTGFDSGRLDGRVDDKGFR